VIRWSLLLLLAALVAGCLVEPVDFTGKSCEADDECEGLVCVEGACASSSAVFDSGTPTGEGEGEARARAMLEAVTAEAEAETAEAEAETAEAEAEMVAARTQETLVTTAASTLASTRATTAASTRAMTLDSMPATTLAPSWRSTRSPGLVWRSSPESRPRSRGPAPTRLRARSIRTSARSPSTDRSRCTPWRRPRTRSAATGAVRR
jgi:hypothetical protein